MPPDIETTKPQPILWHSEYQLPIVANGNNANLQVILGGLHLVLSRLSPEFANDRYPHTRRLAKLLVTMMSRPLTDHTLLTAAQLRACAAEVDTVADAGTKLTLQRLTREIETAEKAQETTDGVHVSDMSASAFLALSNMS